MAAETMSLGIKANLFRHWVRDAEIQQRVPAVLDVADTASRAARPIAAGFVPVQMPAAAAPSTPTGEIRVEVRRVALSVVMTWPGALAIECGSWLRDLPR